MPSVGANGWSCLRSVSQFRLDGHSRLVAAQAGGMERQTLRDWVIRYNADGLTGLADRPRPGRQPRLTEAQRCEVAKWVEDGLTARPMA